MKAALQESCMQILEPQRRVDILRDAMEARQQRRPFVIAFCGVNGVGKSTNLAKVSLITLAESKDLLFFCCPRVYAKIYQEI